MRNSFRQNLTGCINKGMEGKEQRVEITVLKENNEALRAKLAVEEQEVKSLLEIVVGKDLRLLALEAQVGELNLKLGVAIEERDEARRLENVYRNDYNIAKKEDQVASERLKRVEKLLHESCQKNDAMHVEYRKRVEHVVAILVPDL